MQKAHEKGNKEFELILKRYTKKLEISTIILAHKCKEGPLDTMPKQGIDPNENNNKTQA